MLIDYGFNRVTELLGFAKKKKSSLYHSPPQTEGNPHTSNGPMLTVFCFLSVKKTYQLSQLGKINTKRFDLLTLMCMHVKKFIQWHNIYQKWQYINESWHNCSWVKSVKNVNKNWHNLYEIWRN